MGAAAHRGGIARLGTPPTTTDHSTHNSWQPLVPFSAINYAAGASRVRLLPLTLATLAGVVPGTAAVVILGDALTGHPSPMLFVASVCTGALGLTGLVLEMRHYRKRHRTHLPPSPESVLDRKAVGAKACDEELRHPACVVVLVGVGADA